MLWHNSYGGSQIIKLQPPNNYILYMSSTDFPIPIFSVLGYSSAREQWATCTFNTYCLMLMFHITVHSLLQWRQLVHGFQDELGLCDFQDCLFIVCGVGMTRPSWLLMNEMSFMRRLSLNRGASTSIAIFTVVLSSSLRYAWRINSLEQLPHPSMANS